MILDYRLTHPEARKPTRAKPGDSGLDLCALVPSLEGGWCVIPPGGTRRVRTGIAIALPDGYEGQVRPRSGLSSKGIIVSFGTIDNGYRGEIEVTVTNLTRDWWPANNGDRIAQLVVAPIAYPELVENDDLGKTERDVAGFGSTGVR